MQESDVALLLSVVALFTSLLCAFLQVRLAAEKDDRRDSVNALTEIIEDIETAAHRYYAKPGSDPTILDDEKLIVTKLKHVGLRIAQLQMSVSTRARLERLHIRYRQAVTLADFQSANRAAAASSSDRFTKIAAAATSLTLALGRV